MKTEGITLKETLIARSDFALWKPDLRTCWYEFPNVVVPNLTIFSTTSSLDRAGVLMLNEPFQHTEGSIRASKEPAISKPQSLHMHYHGT